MSSRNKTVRQKAVMPTFGLHFLQPRFMKSGHFLQGAPGHLALCLLRISVHKGHVSPFVTVPLQCLQHQ
ncbi:hypothetical protein BBBOND_0211780 [Babesia bigemina]|uniref:Uncharacterized protein n=1 Tax=Babesia bigemina TaxID=5866 RepID=A0A061D5N2_BABBI|nr:hypothetical protein BBBOND_0211780 [Babesia bigemina]CDR96036.1 hypothetical protein BBBOND_0211780 [Babesia bigemina]|eukprot:XP_012768222.1 hypothetical protein BBBOND_0211780 [Babesia bigemina]